MPYKRNKWLYLKWTALCLWFFPTTEIPSPSKHVKRHGVRFDWTSSAKQTGNFRPNSLVNRFPFPPFRQCPESQIHENYTRYSQSKAYNEAYSQCNPIRSDISPRVRRNCRGCRRHYDRESEMSANLFREAGDDYSLVQTLPRTSAWLFTKTSLKRVNYFERWSLQRMLLVEWLLLRSPLSTSLKQFRNPNLEVRNREGKLCRFHRWYTRQVISCIRHCIRRPFRRPGSKQLLSQLDQ